jgi:hypothetical protein
MQQLDADPEFPYNRDEVKAKMEQLRCADYKLVSDMQRSASVALQNYTSGDPNDLYKFMLQLDAIGKYAMDLQEQYPGYDSAALKRIFIDCALTYLSPEQKTAIFNNLMSEVNRDFLGAVNHQIKLEDAIPDEAMAQYTETQKRTLAAAKSGLDMLGRAARSLGRELGRQVPDPLFDPNSTKRLYDLPFDNQFAGTFTSAFPKSSGPIEHALFDMKADLSLEKKDRLCQFLKGLKVPAQGKGVPTNVGAYTEGDDFALTFTDAKGEEQEEFILKTANLYGRKSRGDVNLDAVAPYNETIVLTAVWGLANHGATMTIVNGDKTMGTVTTPRGGSIETSRQFGVGQPGLLAELNDMTAEPKEGYSFAGWKLTIDGEDKGVVETGETLTADRQLELAKYTDQNGETQYHDCTFTATFEGTTVNVHYDLNGATLIEGKDPLADRAFSTGGYDTDVYTATAVNNAYKKEGEVFTGWNTAADGSGVMVDASNANEVLTEDMTLPMQWMDSWTIWQAVILAAELIIAVLCRKSEKEEDEANAAA